MGSEQNRLLLQQRQEPRKRWGGCWGAFSCFGTKKGGTRIVPSSRIPESNGLPNQRNGPQALPNQPTTLAPSIFAPPSSPASFTHSALPSTTPSPNNMLSLSRNSPGGPSNSMYATGPYAHETQLVSPPVFSTFTTEPSTAPLTPPPELAHLTTPSSPDVPYAQFLSSSRGFKAEFLASSLGSGDGLSSSFPERDFPPNWDPSVSPDKYSRTGSGRLYGFGPTGVSKGSNDANFFCPATFAEFYLDHNPNTGGRLSVSKDSDVTYTGNGNGNGDNSRQMQNRSPKQDCEEMEAYRASFGFSADEIITTSQYVEIRNVADESFSMAPSGSNHPPALDFSGVRSWKQGNTNVSGSSTPGSKGNRGSTTDGEGDRFSKLRTSKSGRKHHMAASVSDAEVEYRRGRSVREEFLASSLGSGDGLSSSFPERDFPPNWDPSVSPDKYSRTGSGRLYGFGPTGVSKGSNDANFFCPATFAEFYLDHNPNTGGRLSVSKDSDVTYTGNGDNSRQMQNRSPKQDCEEMEAYRASFGFSADEIITTSQYVEIRNVADESFTMAPSGSNHPPALDFSGVRSWKQQGNTNVSGSSTPGGNHGSTTDGEGDRFSKLRTSKSGRKHHMAASVSDAEVEYRRGRSVREGRGGGFAWNG